MQILFSRRSARQLKPAALFTSPNSISEMIVCIPPDSGDSAAYWITLFNFTAR